jgi:hypothetical protein
MSFMKRIARHFELLGLRFKRAALEHAFNEYDEDRSDEVAALSVRIGAIRRELAS